MWKLCNEMRYTLKLLQPLPVKKSNFKNIASDFRLMCIRFQSNMNSEAKPEVFPTLPKRSKPLTAGNLCLLIIPVTAFGLGTWQIKRLKWKEALIEELNTKTHMPPVDFPEDLSELENLEYRKVKLCGHFDHDKEIYYGPRPLITDGSVASSELISKSGQRLYGYLVITPFVLSDTNQRILVNRGWVETKQKLPSKRPEGQVQGEQNIVGIVRKSEPKGEFTLERDKKLRVWYHRNIEQMAEETDCLPVYVDATVESSIPGIITGGQTQITLRNEHLSYILTWYSLSAATAFMWYRHFIHV